MTDYPDNAALRLLLADWLELDTNLEASGERPQRDDLDELRQRTVELLGIKRAIDQVEVTICNECLESFDDRIEVAILSDRGPCSICRRSDRRVRRASATSAALEQARDRA